MCFHIFSPFSLCCPSLDHVFFHQPLLNYVADKAKIRLSFSLKRTTVSDFFKLDDENKIKQETVALKIICEFKLTMLLLLLGISGYLLLKLTSNCFLNFIHWK